MVVRIAHRLDELNRADETSQPPWEEYCRKARKYWTENLPDDPEIDWVGTRR